MQEQCTFDRWTALWQALGASSIDKPLFSSLLERYSEPHRKYHTLQHLNECLNNFEPLSRLPSHPAEVELAIWFHDAIYDLGRSDNEARSADWARTAIVAAGLSEEVAARVSSLIMATCHDAIPSGIDAQALVDIDLWILGAPPARFAEYERQIREEYQHVPGPVFQQKRQTILKQFLARPKLFSTPVFHEHYEQQARHNLTCAIHQLAQ